MDPWEVLRGTIRAAAEGDASREFVLTHVFVQPAAETRASAVADIDKNASEGHRDQLVKMLDFMVSPGRPICCQLARGDLRSHQLAATASESTDSEVVCARERPTQPPMHLSLHQPAVAVPAINGGTAQA